MNRLLGERDAFTLHHNHPSNSLLSDVDLTMLAYPGLSHVVAHAHDGNTYIAALGPRYRDARSDVRAKNDVLQAKIVARYKAAIGKMQSVIGAALRNGSLSYEDAGKLTNDIVMRWLAHEGTIDYQTTRVLPADVADRLRAALMLEPDDGVDAGFTRTLRFEARDAGLPGSDAGQPGQGRSERAEGNPGRGTLPPGSRQARLLDSTSLSDARQEAALAALREEEERLPAVPPIQRGIVGRIGEAAAHIMDRARDVGFAVQQMLTPMSTGSGRAQTFASNFAHAMRSVAFRYGSIDREITKAFSPAERDAMGRAMDAQSVFEQTVRKLPADQQAAARATFEAGGTGISSLSPAAQRTLHLLDRLSQDVWRRMQERGMVDPQAQPLPWYFSRQILMHDGEGGYERPVSGGGRGGNRGLDQVGSNLTTAGPMRRSVPRRRRDEPAFPYAIMTGQACSPQARGCTHRRQLKG
jgi:hypothetical protein